MRVDMVWSGLVLRSNLLQLATVSTKEGYRPISHSCTKSRRKVVMHFPLFWSKDGTLPPLYFCLFVFSLLSSFPASLAWYGEKFGRSSGALGKDSQMVAIFPFDRLWFVLVDSCWTLDPLLRFPRDGPLTHDSNRRLRPTTSCCDCDILAKAKFGCRFDVPDSSPFPSCDKGERRVSEVTRRRNDWTRSLSGLFACVSVALFISRTTFRRWERVLFANNVREQPLYSAPVLHARRATYNGVLRRPAHDHSSSLFFSSQLATLVPI